MEKKYQTLSEATEIATTRCNGWRFATSESEYYDSAELKGVAEIHDGEAGLDEDSFYLVSPGGAIGFSQDGETIEWLFLPLESSEELPLSLAPKAAVNFCPKCGEPAVPGALFCGACGAKLS